MPSSRHHAIRTLTIALALTSAAAFSWAQTAPRAPFSVPERGTTGNTRNGPIGALPSKGGLDPGVARNALEALHRGPERARRGVTEAQIFRTISPSVVLIATNAGSGSGSLLPGNRILTNWHVVGVDEEVGIIFRPDAGFDLAKAKVVAAKVVRVDQVADLALLQLSEPPPATAKPVPLAANGSLSVGDDVHAIGHPTGEAWTYTKGYVSQVRPAYEWFGRAGAKHRAEVVQTQTPINPGNSGGPLLNDAGALVGVNSFILRESEGLNFAVAVSEVRSFLARADNRIAERDPMRCEGEILFDGRNEANDSDLRVIDRNCNDIADLFSSIPDAKDEAVILQLDDNEDDKMDGVIVDENRDGKWDVSYWDEDGDGKTDMKGNHENGQVDPSSLTPYTPS